MTSKNDQRIQQYVKDLCQSDRYIVMLYYADELTVVEIASVLEMTPTQVDSRLNYFRAQFRGLIDQNRNSTNAVA